MLPVAIKFILLPFYLMVLDPTEYGILALIYIFSSLYEFSNLKIQTAVQTYYFDYNDEPKKLKEYLSNILSFSILLSGLTTLVLGLTGGILFSYIFTTVNVSFYPNGLYAILASFMLVNLRIYYSYLKNRKALIEFASYSMSLVLFKIGFQVLFLFGFKMGISGILLGDLIGTALVFIYFLLRKYNLITFHLKKKYIQPSLKYSFTLLPFFIVLWSSQKIDRFYIERLLDVSYVGKYAVLVAVTSLIAMVIDGASTAFRPYLFEYFKKGVNEHKKEIQQLEKVFMTMGILAASFIIALGLNLDLFITNEKYLSIIELVPLAVMVPLIFGWVILLSQQLIYSKQASKISLVSWISLFVQLVLYYFFIPVFKLEGVLWVNIIGNFIMCVFFYFYGKKLFPVPHQLKYIIGLPLLFFGSVCGLQYIFSSQGWSLNILGLIQFLIIGLSLMLFSFKDIKSIFQSKLKKKKV